jgi:adenylyltransferase/sulfurtransferase
VTENRKRHGPVRGRPERLTDEQFERYTRHVLLRDVGEDGQVRLLSSTVAVRVGPNCAAEIAAIVYLAAAGVGRILLGGDASEPVTRADVDAGLLYGRHDIGRSRLDAICDRVGALNPDVRVAAEHPGDAVDARLPALRADGDTNVAGALVEGGAAAARLLAELVRSEK